MAEHDLGAAETLGGLPMLPGCVVVVWRCSEDEARHAEQSARFDCVIYSEIDEFEGTPTLRYSIRPTGE